MIKITLLHNELDEFVNLNSGFSLFIDIDNKKILLDTSHSDDFITNAKKVGIDPNKVDYLILSHGHWDHTNGLKFLNNKNITIISHPNCFEKKNRDVRYIGAPLTKEEAEKKFKLSLRKEPYEFTKNIIFLGEIPRSNDFEGKKPVGIRETGEDDYVLDDSALAIKTKNGLIVITGCGHSGICNTTEYAKKVAKENQIVAVMGGFHLFNKDQTDKTIEYFKNQKITNIYPMHCLDQYAFLEFEKIGAHRLRTLDNVIF